MNRKDHRELSRYTRALADLMGLRDWTIRVDLGDPGNDGAHEGTWIGCCLVTPFRRSAVITIDPALRDQPRDEVRSTMVHELTHCHLDAMRDQVYTDLLGQMGQPTYDVFTGSFLRNLEHATDAIAEAWAPTLPLITWP